MDFAITFLVIGCIVALGVWISRYTHQSRQQMIAEMEDSELEATPTPEPEPEEPVAVEMPHIEPAPEAKPAAKPRSRKKKVEYKPNAVDRDKDGLVQDGTPFERPAEPKPAPKKRRGRPGKKA